MQYREDNTPILIEIEAAPEIVAIDGRDFLYGAFELGDPEKAAPALETLFGPRILRFAQSAWNSTNHDKRLVLCDLAIHDPEVVADHYRNRVVIGGKYSTRFFAAFINKVAN
jgi:hypothetical protein